MPSVSNNKTCRMSPEYLAMFEKRIRPYGLTHAQFSSHVARIVNKLSKDDLQLLIGVRKKRK